MSKGPGFFAIVPEVLYYLNVNGLSTLKGLEIF